MAFNFFNSTKRNLEKSGRLCSIAGLAIMKGHMEKANSLHKLALSICPENPMPYFPTIVDLYNKGKVTESYDLYQKLKNIDYEAFRKLVQDIDWKDSSVTSENYTAQIIHMLISTDHIDEANQLFINELDRFNSIKDKAGEDGDNIYSSYKKGFFNNLVGTASFFTADGYNTLFPMLTRASEQGYLSVDEVNSYKKDSLCSMSTKAGFLIKERKTKEALEACNWVLEIDPSNIDAMNWKETIIEERNKLKYLEKINLLSETYLFFDTETTGLPLNWNAPVSDVDNWPRLVQIAWLLCDKDSNIIFKGNHIIKPEGFLIPAEASNIHKITTQKAEKEGKELKIILEEFKNLVDKSGCLVAHNISFDEKIVGAEFIRKNLSNNLIGKNKICTKEQTTNFCAIPSPNGFNDYKWPKLSELYYKLFGEEIENAHDAMEDVKATAKCFWELKRKGIL